MGGGWRVNIFKSGSGSISGWGSAVGHADPAPDIDPDIDPAIDPDPDFIGNKKNTLGIRRVCVFAGIIVMGSNARLQLQLEAAKKYCESGISVIPIKEGSKFPDRNLLAQAGGSSPRGYASLAPFQKRIPRQMEIQVWFAKEPMNLAIVIGLSRTDSMRAFTSSVKVSPRTCSPKPIGSF